MWRLQGDRTGPSPFLFYVLWVLVGAKALLEVPNCLAEALSQSGNARPAEKQEPDEKYQQQMRRL